jgi:hypothetical protein
LEDFYDIDDLLAFQQASVWRSSAIKDFQVTQALTLVQLILIMENFDST